MKRICALLLCLLMLMSGVTALAEDFHPEWTWPEEGTELSGEIITWCEGDYLEKGAADFNKYYPNIKVTYVNIPWSEYWKKVLMTLSAGEELPDIMQFEQGYRGAQLAVDEWEELTREPYNLDVEAIADTVLPICVGEDGRICTIQFDNCVGGIAYDRYLMKEYFGISEPEEVEAVFATWEDYYEKARELHEKSNGTITMWTGVSECFRAAEAMTIKEKLVIDNKLNTEQIHECLRIVQNFVETGAVGKIEQYSPAWNASWSTGRNLFYPCASYVPSYNIAPNDPEGVKIGRWGLIAGPNGGGFVQGGTGLAIPKGKSEEQKKLAWTFIRFMCQSNEGATSWMINNNGVPSYKPAYDLPAVEVESPLFGGQQIVKKFVEIAENPNTAARPICYYDAVVFEVLNQVVVDLAKGKGADETYQKFLDELMLKYPELTL